MKRTKRWIGIGLATTMAALGLEVLEAPSVGAAKASLTCQGITGDNASSLGDSRATLGVISSTGITLDVDITPTIPAKVRPDAGAFDASFGINVNLPATVVSAAKTTLGLSSLEVKDIRLAINATGAATQAITTTIASRTVDLNAASVSINETVSGKVTPTSAGNIVFRPGATRMSIAINKSVGPATINTLTIECTSNSALGITSVSVPGSPNIGGNFEGQIWGGAYSGSVGGVKLLDTPIITPDDGNPIISDSLAVTGSPNPGGAAAAAGGAVFFLAPAGATGVHNVPMRVCGASRMTRFIPGVNEVQRFTWGEDHRIKKDLNAKPYAVTLTWEGKETDPIPLSQTPQLFAAPRTTPVDQNQWDFADRFLSDFVAPSAGQVQTALEKIMGAGNVKVTGGANNGPYQIEFAGALAKGDRTQVEVGKWLTWLPSDLLTTALETLNPPAQPGQTTTTTTPPLTNEQLDAALAAGTITIEKWFEGKLTNLRSDIIAGFTSPESIQAITNLLPKKPAMATVTEGVTEEPSVPTGPLCTSFDVSFLVAPAPVAVAGASTTRVRRCSNVRVKNSKGRYYTKRVCRLVTVKTTRR